MDFFGAQDRARTKTRVLIGYFALGLFGIIVSIYLLASFAGIGQSSSSGQVQLWDPWRFIFIAIIVCTVVFIASWIRISGLKSGGAKVAESLGGRRIALNTRDPKERQLLNVVEEMSIASGVPMPDVFVLDNESSINAFAAGFTFDDAAVAVTRGTLDLLNRDELQGVIAHEFSHILSGDMRINIRLMGIIFGILVISLFGRIILHSSSSRLSTRRSSNDKSQAGIFFLGLSLVAIGYLGVLFGRLIQAAISRQREFLADSAAVQFTRNPDGIANALRKIGGHSSGSSIRDPHAQEISHMFFARGLNSLFATHPPLRERIAAIQPLGFDESSQTRPPRRNVSDPSAQGSQTSSASASANPLLRNPQQAFISGIGVIAADALAKAKTKRETLHQNFGSALEETDRAVELLLALLLAPENDLRTRQLGFIQQDFPLLQHSRIEENAHILGTLSSHARFDVLDLSVAPLRSLDQNEGRKLLNLLRRLAEADDHLELEELLILRAASQHLKAKIAGPNTSDSLLTDPSQLVEPVSQILSFIAVVGASRPEEAKAAFDQNVTAFKEMIPGIRFAQPESDLRRLDPALDTLGLASYQIRSRLLETATAIVLADEKVTDREMAFLRAISLAIGCPTPSLDY
ncbi:MAG: M48 family metallopeptidase [Puniceicoccaceae bacterium]